MLRGGEAVLVAVSGGSDSVALLDVLCELRSELRLTLDVIHVHHGLRPESDAEAESVRRLCGHLGVPCHVERVTVRRGPPWEGLEAESRRARHAAFRTRAQAVGAARIATGHTADDQAETVLMRLLQGAGPRGLAGIAPARGLLIRPLLETRRSEVLAHLRRRGLSWVEDPSNREPRFLRNRIRQDVLPFIGEATGGSVVEALCRSAALTRPWVADLEARAQAELAVLGGRDASGLTFAVAELTRRPLELAGEVLVQAMAALGETRPLRGAAQRALRRLLGPGPGRRALRLGRLAVERSGPWLRVGPAALPALAARAWAVPGALEMPEAGLRLVARCFDRPPGYAAPRGPERVAFDADCLPPVLGVRARRAGDRFTPFGAPAERRLKSFLIDVAVPRWRRPRLPLVVAGRGQAGSEPSGYNDHAERSEAGGEIVWVAGVRRGSAAPVTPGTTRILEVTVEPL